MSAQKDISVVIGFKDWGLRRLSLAVSTIQASFGDLEGEVIVSDYGSVETAETQRVLEGLGARYVYTETDGSWSRTRALNAGFAVSTGRVLVSTDADMVFSPGAMQTIGRMVLASPTSGLLLQCRDLPSQWTDAEIEEHGADWAEFEAVGRRRPRWGMGGMIAVHRDVFLKIRGYDERMKTYGGEDIDFAQRVRRAGARLIWVEEPEVRMYHMWHPSTADKHALSAEESAQVDANKAIMREDKTFVRNITSWTHRPPDARPLVSVVISTFNRASLISDTLHSLQAQTVQDFEVVVVDDGSVDNTRDVVESFADERVRYFYQDNAGVAAARNRGVAESHGQYIAVLDDDDIALPWRLEAHFASLTDGVHATYGAFANFDDSTGAISVYATKKFTEETTADKGGAPGHSTWMIERELMAAIRYDEALVSGIDNNFALRALRSGLVWKHTGRVMTLRRVHPEQITAQLSESQVGNARDAYGNFTFLATTWGLAKLRKERGSGDFVAIQDAPEDLVPYLPDHLVTRSVMGEVGRPASTKGAIRCTLTGRQPRYFLQNFDVKWEDLARLRGDIGAATLNAALVHTDSGTVSPAQMAPLRSVLSHLRSEEWDALPAGARNERVLIEMMTNDQDAYALLKSDVRDSLSVVEGDSDWLAWGVSIMPVRDIDAHSLRELSRHLTVRVHGVASSLSLVSKALSVDNEEMSA